AAPQTIQVTLPSNMTCDHCTLQVIEFMSEHPLNNPGGCFYHHCANISIGATPADGGPGPMTATSAGSGPAASSGSGTATNGAAAAGSAANGAGGSAAAGPAQQDDAATRATSGCDTTRGEADAPLGLVAVAVAAMFISRRRRSSS